MIEPEIEELRESFLRELRRAEREGRPLRRPRAEDNVWPPGEDADDAV